jgi:SseB protein N-terminal domain
MSLVSYAAKLAIKPKGPVEEAIFGHIWQQTPIDTVLAPLMQADVFLYAQKSDGPDPKPLVMAGKDGKPAMLVFTSRDRAAAVAKQLPPGSAEPLTQPFQEVLRWAPVELGLVINSGSALAAECSAAHMDALRKQAGIFRP